MSNSQGKYGKSKLSDIMIDNNFQRYVNGQIATPGLTGAAKKNLSKTSSRVKKFES